MKKSFLILLVLCVMGMFVSSHAENTYKNPYYEKGYLGNVALGGTVGLVNDFGSRLTLLTSHGHSFGNGIFVGGGLGVITDIAGNNTVPIFADFKYSFLDKAASPFIDYKFGYSYYNLSYSSVYVSPSVGIDVGKFTFSISYIFHDCLVIVYDNYTDNPQIDLGSDAIQAFKNHWLSFTVALNF